MEVEPLHEPQLEDVGLDNCIHDISLSYKKIPSVDEPEPQPLPNFPSLGVSLGDQRDPKPPIKPYSPDSFRMKAVDHLTIHIPPSPYVAYSHLGLGDPKKHYGFKLGLSGALGVDYYYSKFGRDKNNFVVELSLPPVKQKELEKAGIKETRHLEHIIQQTLIQHMTSSHHNDVYRYYQPHLTLSVEKPSPLLRRSHVRTCDFESSYKTRK
ncbi:hypothetical protein Tco_1036159 [Tanacetum coccineum]